MTKTNFLEEKKSSETKIQMEWHLFDYTLGETVEKISERIVSNNRLFVKKNEVNTNFVKLQIEGILIVYFFNVLASEQRIISIWGMKETLSPQLYEKYYNNSKNKHREKVINLLEINKKKSLIKDYDIIINEVENSIICYNKKEKMPISEGINVISLKDEPGMKNLYNYAFYGVLIEVLISYITEKLLKNNINRLVMLSCMEDFFAINRFEKELKKRFEFL